MATKTTATKRKRVPVRRTTARAATTAPKAKRTRADVLADILTKQFNGKAALTDLTEYVTKHKSLPALGSYPYRTLSGVITQDKGRTLKRVAPGVVGVVKARKAAK